MRFTVQYPVVLPDHAEEIRTAAAIAQFARVAEDVGFDAIAFTEHPAPSQKWIASGGHPSFDPLTALACAAVGTVRLRLLPYVVVLPYRNPLLLAKALATLDVVSEGRLVVGAGVGYLRSEFAALGSPFDERNELFDEAVAAMTAIWSGENVVIEGRHFHAVGQTAIPPPVQRPHPPLWIGGNSRRARRRAAEVGSAWMPLLVDDAVAGTVRTPALASLAALEAAVRDLRDLVVAAGRSPGEILVQAEGRESRALFAGPTASLSSHRAFLSELEAAGVGQFVVDTPAGSLREALDALERYGRDVIAMDGR
jgi:probable F420-dependent oxidoreductase